MGIHQALIGSYSTSTPSGSIWSVPSSSLVTGTTNYTISNLQIGDLVFFISVDNVKTQNPLPGWSTLISGFNDPLAMASFRKAIVDTSFTIPNASSGGALADNFAVVVVRSTKNTITLLESVVAIGGSSTGFPSIPSTNMGNQAIPSLTNDPFTVAFGFYNNDDVTSSSAPSAAWTYLGLSNSGNTTAVSAYSLDASSGDTAPPGAGNSFGNPSSGSDDNSTIVMYTSTEDRTVRTWSIVDSVFQDLEDDGTGLTVNNLQQGDFVYWTQAGDNAGSTPTASGWFSTFQDTDNTPSFKEQVQTVGSGVTSISVTCESDCEVGALIAFRCSSGATTLESQAFAVTEGGNGDPVVPDQHFGTLGTSLPLTSENDCLCVVTGYLDDDDISLCTAPTGLTLAGFAGGNRFFGFNRSSLMVAYGVSMEQEAGPLAGGRAWTTDGSDNWNCTGWYVNPS